MFPSVNFYLPLGSPGEPWRLSVYYCFVFSLQPTVCRSATASACVTPTRLQPRLPNAAEALPKPIMPMEVHSAPASDTDTASRRGGRGGEQRVSKVADRFHVKGVFQVKSQMVRALCTFTRNEFLTMTSPLARCSSSQDVLGSGRTTSGLKGTPHRKAVLAALSSMDAPAETTSPYDSVADAPADGGYSLLRKSFEDLDADAGPPSYSPPPPPLARDYQKDFPYLSTTPITSYRPRSADSARLNLISRRNLLDMDL